MKFGAVAPKEAVGATAVHTIRQGRLVLKKGTLIGAGRSRGAGSCRHQGHRRGAARAGDVSEDVAAAEIAKAVAGPGVHVDRAFTGRANLFAQTPGVLGRRQGRGRPSQPHRRGDHVRDAASLQAGGRRRDDRDRQDHSIRASARRRAMRRSQAARKAADARRALSHPQGRHRLDAAARSRHQGDREDAEDHRRASSRPPAPPSLPSGGCRMSARRSRKRSTRCSRPAPNWSSYSALPPSPTGAT